MADSTSSTPGGKQQQKVSISTVAHAKMILHAACKATQQVHGILIGHFVGAAAANAAPTLVIEDVLPVCHEAPTKPIVDTSLRLAGSHCDSLSDSRVVGWYTANERLGGDERPGQAALRIAASIGARLLAEGAENPLPAHAEPVLIMIGNSALAEILGAENGCDASELPNALTVLGRDQRKHWLRRFPAECVVSDKDGKSFKTSIDAVRSAVSSSSGLALVPLYDFVDHMEGGTNATGERDWLINPNVARMVQN
uniref:MPN domain-containing protein n=1 Tax=Helicotheca tamesis TaxID=374047 RepID=A0A7S2N5A7_9STRA|mmetsp:Transcript_9688/g.13568  ORF Transcript_9688/g.13568 Transcript_9688/m.13568 type:complete len:254 (+) Transcript_9688:69-830(+)|eukprot:CAMPEP_0185736278 /NCGR_PEP_ID=MMETSP1171-20130828/27431_1 /TAXON_ID=374046 /ORGANISM="Helicotheca tamensis, Strain CCMP826" /LENGTH=253 /DNA_ID=CAMNT_0028406825 /DNA_START=48 /DNA_END=809 /DNA_ORIENTATION=+